VLAGFCFSLASKRSSLSRKGNIGKIGRDGFLGFKGVFGFEGSIFGRVDSNAGFLELKVKHKKIKDAITMANSRKVLMFVIRFISYLAVQKA
jgi:hypothetical protein